MKKQLLILLGALSFGLGTVGIVVPFLPTVPLYMLTGFLWLRSSEKLHQTFIESSYYKKYVQENLVERKISTSSLIRMFLMIGVVFLIPGVLVDNKVMRICLAIVYTLHVIILTWYLKFKKSDKKEVRMKVYDR